MFELTDHFIRSNEISFFLVDTFRIFGLLPYKISLLIDRNPHLNNRLFSEFENSRFSPRSVICFPCSYVSHSPGRSCFTNRRPPPSSDINGSFFRPLVALTLSLSAFINHFQTFRSLPRVLTPGWSGSVQKVYYLRLKATKVTSTSILYLR
jgi:hypothetical protein